MSSTALDRSGYTIRMARPGRRQLGKSATMLVTFKAPRAMVAGWEAMAGEGKLSEWLREAAEEKRERETRRKR